MVNEIIAAGYHKKHQVWTNPNKGIQTKHHINFFMISRSSMIPTKIICTQ
jgi:hypothetical protein